MKKNFFFWRWESDFNIKIDIKVEVGDIIFQSSQEPNICHFALVDFAILSTNEEEKRGIQFVVVISLLHIHRAG